MFARSESCCVQADLPSSPAGHVGAIFVNFSFAKYNWLFGIMTSTHVSH